MERRVKSIETLDYIACRRVSPSVEAMQQQSLDEQVPDRAMTHVVECDPEMIMKPVIEGTERRMARSRP